MPEVDQQPVRITGGDEIGLAEYRPVSRWAILAVVLSLASPLVLVNPLLGIVPAAAAICAIAAIVVIARPDAGLVGRKAAVGALLIACFFGAWGGSYFFTRLTMLTENGIAFVDQWLQLLKAGDFESAYQLHADGPASGGPPQLPPMESGMDPESTPPQDPPEVVAEKYFQFPPYDAIIRDLKQGSLKYDRVLEIRRSNSEDYVVLRYVDDKHKPYRITARWSPIGYQDEPLWLLHTIVEDN